MIAALLALLAAPTVTPGQDAHYHLDNGLEVILRHDRRAPLVAVRLRSPRRQRRRSARAQRVWPTWSSTWPHEGSTHVAPRAA